MAYNVDNIIQLNVRISPQGLGFANFASALMFAPETELPAGFSPDTYREYATLSDLALDFAPGTETYQAMNRWLGGTPSISSVKVWGAATADADWTTTLNKARNSLWWFWSFFTADVYAASTDVIDIAEWHNSNESYFQNCQTGTSAGQIRDPNNTTDIATVLTTNGYRFASTFSHATDPYAGISVCKWLAKVNYSAVNSTITAEYKKLSGVAAESLTQSEYGAMEQATKKCQFYTVAELKGSVDAGRVMNTWTHSTYGEYMDDVVNLSAFTNSLQVTLYNTIANSTTKVGQDPVGQSLLIGSAKSVCEQFIANGYLGPRNYTDPDDGIDKYTIGYEILTKPEDILSISDVDRDNRLSAPLRIRIFRKGAIHKAIVDIDVY